MSPAVVSSLSVAIRSNLSSTASGSVYAIVDACQAPDLVSVAKTTFGQLPRMLFKGAAAAATEIETVAPFLISVDLKNDFIEQWAAIWGSNAGLLFISSAQPRSIFRHLREIFVVKNESDQEYFFRFYDPRVLRAYLPTCTYQEIALFFGPLTSILIEGKRANTFDTFSHASGELHISTCDPISDSVSFYAPGDQAASVPGPW